MSMPFINASRVKQYAIETASGKKMSNGQPRYTRVSKEFLQEMNDLVRNRIQQKCQNLPSSGHTI